MEINNKAACPYLYSVFDSTGKNEGLVLALLSYTDNVMEFGILEDSVPYIGTDIHKKIDNFRNKRKSDTLKSED